MTAGKGWAWSGFGLGVAVSVAGNIAHTWHPSQAVLRAAGKTAAQWHPEPGAQLIAAFFAIANTHVLNFFSVSNFFRFFHTFTNTSWVRSSASPSLPA